MDLVIASTNLHKIREFREMMKNIKHIEVLSLLNFPGYMPPEETGNTFEENSLLKALHAAKELNKMVLADDSGLVVPCLGGAPGVNSRRYAGEDATDAENRQKLLKVLIGRPDHERSAFFQCTLTLANHNGMLKQVTGICEGIVLAEEKGRNGFGYDSLFMKHDYDKTFAELDEATKNRVSHRRKAFEKMIVFLEGLNSGTWQKKSHLDSKAS